MILHLSFGQGFFARHARDEEKRHAAHSSHHGFHLGFAGDVGGEADRRATKLLDLHGPTDHRSIVPCFCLTKLDGKKDEEFHYALLDPIRWNGTFYLAAHLLCFHAGLGVADNHLAPCFAQSQSDGSADPSGQCATGASSSRAAQASAALILNSSLLFADVCRVAGSRQCCRG
jgi:hypothetical protein